MNILKKLSILILFSSLASFAISADIEREDTDHGSTRFDNEWIDTLEADHYQRELEEQGHKVHNVSKKDTSNDKPQTED